MKRFLFIFFGLSILEVLLYYLPVHLVPSYEGSMKSHSNIDTLDMRYDGHIFIKASIGSDTTKYWFMFDTGFTTSVIDEELIKKYALPQFVKGYKVRDGNNTSGNAQVTKVPELNIGHTSFRNMTFAKEIREPSACFEKKSYGIVGSNIIRRANWLIDFDRNKVYMIKKGSVELSGFEIFTIPFKSSYVNGVPKIEVAVNGIFVDYVIFDTGSNGWLDLPFGIFKTHQSEFKKQNKFESYGEHSKSFFGPTEEKVTLLIVDKLKIGNLELNKQPVNFASKTSKILGNSFLSSYNIYLNNQRKEITLLSRGPKQVHSIESNDRSGFGFALKYEEDKKVRIARVNTNSPADKAGIEYNDELLAIDGVSYSGDECGLGEWFKSTVDLDTTLEVEIKNKGILKLLHGQF